MRTRLSLILVFTFLSCFDPTKTRAGDEPAPAAGEHALRFLVMAEHAPALGKVLRPNDVVFAFCPRMPDLPPGMSLKEAATQGRKPNSKWSEENFRRRMDALAAVDGKTVQKAVVFSTLVDFKDHAEALPADLAWVMYNSEEGVMTPMAEINAIETSVNDFAALAHRRGRKMAWVPTNTLLSRTNDDLLKLAGAVDCVVLQHQRVLQDRGLDVFRTETRRRAEAIHKANPKCLVIVQVVLGRSTVEESIAALKGIRDTVDGCCAWTMRDTDGIVAVIEGVRQTSSPRLKP